MIRDRSRVCVCAGHTVKRGGVQEAVVRTDGLLRHLHCITAREDYIKIPLALFRWAFPRLFPVFFSIDVTCVCVCQFVCVCVCV